MLNYLYKIAKKNGLVKTGQIEAMSEIDAAESLKQEGWHIISIKQKESFLNLGSSANKKISFLEKISLTDHLSSMIGSGTPIIEALEAYQEEKNPKITVLIDSLIRNIKQGQRISEALALHPTVFSPFYLALVQAGELTGTLDETLSYLGNELRKEHEFKEKVKSALIYPALVVATSIAVISLLVFLVIPKITELTSSLGGELPLATRIILSLINVLSRSGPIVLLIALAAAIATMFLFRNSEKREQIDLYSLKTPFIGPIIKKYNLTRFLMIISSCLRCGVPLTASFSTAVEVVGNRQYKKACERINERIKKGSSLSEAISLESKILFPKIVIRTIKGAEKNGTVDVAMARLSSFYEAEINRSLKRVIDLIEPILIIVLGIMVCGIAIAVIAPIYQITTKIK